MTRQGIFLLILSFLLSLLGIFILYESSTYTALLSVGDKYYYARNQAVWFVIGAVACIIVSKLDYKIYYKLALPGLLVSLVLLFLVFIPGIGLELKGAHRWINFGFTVVQPSELLKITLTLYLAAWLSSKEKARLFAFLLLLGLSVALVIIEPDMGTGTIIAITATTVYFLSGAPIRDMILIIGGMIGAGLALVQIAPYRVARLTSFQNFDVNNLSTASYHIRQILVALGAGGLFGVGFGNSVQKYAYLPESTTDSIFAIFAEEAGFAGSALLVIAFIAFIFTGFYIASKSQDLFGKLLAAGIVTFIGIQAFINMASQAVLMPLTGVPLPFISYGGSSLIINLVSVGILLSIARRETEAKSKGVGRAASVVKGHRSRV